jgi:hypothetical protein
MAALIVQDEPDLIALYIPEGAPFDFAPVAPIPHPWEGRAGWTGHGLLSLHRPGDPYTVLVFWEGPDRTFSCWYVNLQTPLTRSRVGFDMLDHELDLWSADGKTWHWKDDELLDQRVAEGLYTEEEARTIRAAGAQVRRDLETNGLWWDESWADWRPDPAWSPPALPAGWRKL